MKIIDSHVHLNLEQFDNDREEVFKRIEEKLDFVVNIGFDLESSEKSVEYANKYPFIYAVIGFHPDEIEGYSDEAEKKLEELAKNQLKLKRTPLLLENSEYHGYTYNENNTIVFIGGENPKYYYNDYKINVVRKPVAVLDLLKTSSNYYVSDFFR